MASSSSPQRPTSIQLILSQAIPPLLTVPQEVRSILKMPPNKDVRTMNMLMYGKAEMDDVKKGFFGGTSPIRRKVFVMCTYNTLYIIDALKGTAITVFPHSEVSMLQLISKPTRPASAQMPPRPSLDGDPQLFEEHRVAPSASLLLQTLDKAHLALHFTARETGTIKGSCSAPELARLVKGIHDQTHAIMHEADAAAYANFAAGAGAALQPISSGGHTTTGDGCGDVDDSSVPVHHVNMAAQFHADPTKAMTNLMKSLGMGPRKGDDGSPNRMVRGKAMQDKLQSSARALNKAATEVAVKRGGGGDGGSSAGGGGGAFDSGEDTTGNAFGPSDGSGSFAGSLRILKDDGSGADGVSIGSGGGLDAEFPMTPRVGPSPMEGGEYGGAADGGPRAATAEGGAVMGPRRTSSAAAADGSGVAVDPNALFSQMQRREEEEALARRAAEEAPLAVAGVLDSDAHHLDPSLLGGEGIATDATAEFTNAAEDALGSSGARTGAAAKQASAGEGPAAPLTAEDRERAALEAFYRDQAADDDRRAKKEAKRVAKAIAAAAEALAKCEAEEERKRKRLMKKRIRGVNRRFERMDMLLHGEVASFEEAVAGMLEEEQGEDAAEEAAERAVLGGAATTAATASSQSPTPVVAYTPLEPLRTSSIVNNGASSAVAHQYAAPGLFGEVLPEPQQEQEGGAPNHNSSYVTEDPFSAFAVQRTMTSNSNRSADHRRGEPDAATRQPSYNHNAQRSGSSHSANYNTDNQHNLSAGRGSYRRSSSIANHPHNSNNPQNNTNNMPALLEQYGIEQHHSDGAPFDVYATSGGDVSAAHNHHHNHADAVNAHNALSMPTRVHQSQRNRPSGAVDPAFYSPLAPTARSGHHVGDRPVTVPVPMVGFGAFANRSNSRSNANAVLMGHYGASPLGVSAAAAAARTGSTLSNNHHHHHNQQSLMQSPLSLIGSGGGVGGGGGDYDYNNNSDSNMAALKAQLRDELAAEVAQLRRERDEAVRLLMMGGGGGDSSAARALSNTSATDLASASGVMGATTATAAPRYASSPSRDDAYYAGGGGITRTSTVNTNNASAAHSPMAPSSASASPPRNNSNNNHTINNASLLLAERLEEQRRITALLSNQCLDAQSVIESVRRESGAAMREQLLAQQRAYEAMLVEHHDALAAAKEETVALAKEVAALRVLQQQQQQQQMAPSVASGGTIGNASSFIYPHASLSMSAIGSPLRSHEASSRLQQHAGTGGSGAYSSAIAAQYTPYAAFRRGNASATNAIAAASAGADIAAAAQQHRRTMASLTAAGGVMKDAEGWPVGSGAERGPYGVGVGANSGGDVSFLNRLNAIMNPPSGVRQQQHAANVPPSHGFNHQPAGLRADAASLRGAAHRNPSDFFDISRDVFSGVGRPSAAAATATAAGASGSGGGAFAERQMEMQKDL